MKKPYLGDALDLAKRAILSALPETCRDGLAVAPMCTDTATWQAEDRETYRLLLRLTTAIPIQWTPDRTPVIASKASRPRRARCSSTPTPALRPAEAQIT